MPLTPRSRDLLVQPLDGDHLVQVYDAEAGLVEAIALYAGAALGRREAFVMVATAEHRSAVRRALAETGCEVASLETFGQLRFLDAEQQLERFMVDGQPDEQRFQALIAGLVASVRATGYRRIRIYGEMVDILWRTSVPAAARLEAFWNTALRQHSLSLFCAYAPGRQQAPDALPADLGALHTHLLEERIAR